MHASVERILALPREERKLMLLDMSPAECAAILVDWRMWARPRQLAPPGFWRIWLVLAGRGFGKTRTGAEWLHMKARQSTTGRLFLLGATYADVRDTMIEGESGLIACAHPNFRPKFESARKRVKWPNGVTARIFTGEEPERLRGPQHEAGWTDELAAFQYPEESYRQMNLGLRLGPNPQACLTTTPKPLPIIIELHDKAKRCRALRRLPEGDARLKESIGVVMTTGTTYENRENLAEQWYREVVEPVEGTRIGDQEILAKILRDVPGALWNQALIDTFRIRHDADGKLPALPEFDRIAVAVDPAVTSSKHSNETGITVCARSTERHGYLLADRSGRYSPDKWARIAVQLYHEFKADRIVAEANQGGDMVKTTIFGVDPDVPVKLVTATRGKVVRAEPIAAKYEQGKIHHVGTFATLETQMTTWTPDSGLASPDRFDSLVWGFTELLLGKQGAFVA